MGTRGYHIDCLRDVLRDVEKPKARCEHQEGSEVTETKDEISAPKPHNLETVHVSEIVIDTDPRISYLVEIHAIDRIIEISAIKEEIDILIGCGIIKQEIFTHQLSISLNLKIVTTKNDKETGFKTTCIAWPNGER